MKRTALIGTFLGAMELIRHFGVQAQQYELFGEIWISKGEHWTENLDLSQVDTYGSTPTPAA
jgi:chromatin segregation and condensation protein Rec8/ScpA/Scc1 (kleisin family)